MSGMRPFPMQDGPPIPWFIAEAIWTHLYRHSQPLDVVARRGGFGWDEVAYMWGPKHRTTKEQRQACRQQIVERIEVLEFNATVVVAELQEDRARLEADLAALREAAQAVVDAHRSILEAVTPGHENELLTKMRRGDPEAWRGKEQYDARFSQWHAATSALRAVLASADSESREETP